MKNFIKLSQEIGRKPAYIQGRGGNTSYKNKNFLFIKATGLRLKDIHESLGVIRCNIEPFIDFFINTDSRDNADKALNIISDKARFDKNTKYKPSIEIGMHAVIRSKYILHTHSVYVNVFTCMKSPENKLKKILTKYPFKIIPYKNPGYELAAYLFELQKKTSLPPILFLKNHGIVVHSNSLTDVNKIHEYVNSKLQKITGTYATKKQNKEYAIPLITPDAVVYNEIKNKDFSMATSSEITEVASSLLFVTDAIQRLGEKIIYLSKEDIDYILNMEREKFRIQTIHK